MFLFWMNITFGVSKFFLLNVRPFAFWRNKFRCFDFWRNQFWCFDFWQISYFRCFHFWRNKFWCFQFWRNTFWCFSVVDVYVCRFGFLPSSPLCYHARIATKSKKRRKKNSFKFQVDALTHQYCSASIRWRLASYLNSLLTKSCFFFNRICLFSLNMCWKCFEFCETIDV